jgi:hypothetical protein
LNDAEQRLDDGTTGWYMPGQPQWLRRLCWELRNPLQNLRAFVLGVQDKNYHVIGRAPVMTVQRDDLVPPQLGWQWCVLYGGDLVVPRAFVSRCGRRVTWYLGWQSSGFFGGKWNWHRWRDSDLWCGTIHRQRRMRRQRG